jgi:hypothetical protein
VAAEVAIRAYARSDFATGRCRSTGCQGRSDASIFDVDHDPVPVLDQSDHTTRGGFRGDVPDSHA